MKKDLASIYRTLEKHEQKLKELVWHKKLREPTRKPALERHTYYGVHLALCVETRDPLKQGRVQFYSPILHLPDTPLVGLDWAWPISAMGGFDDSGLTWVPPAGSTLCLIFQNGSPDVAFYIGTTWHRDRGRVANRQWGIPIPEFERIYEGHRGGYMVGANDESQVHQPWNTDQYQGFDLDDKDYDNKVNAQVKVTWPHKYGFKTPQKHMLLMDDGDPKCNLRWKRIELISSGGQAFLMKDDPYHYCAEWLNPRCATTTPVEDAPEICTPTIYLQYLIIDATVPDGGGIISLEFDPAGPFPIDGELLAIDNLPGILGAQGTYVYDAGTLVGSNGQEDGGFFFDDQNPFYAISINPDTGMATVMGEAVCSQGPENCPTVADDDLNNLEEIPRTGFVKDITDSAPVTVTTSQPHGLTTPPYDTITIAGVLGMDGANGSWAMTVTGPSTFTLDDCDPPPNVSPSYIVNSGLWIITVEDEYQGTEGLCYPHVGPADKVLPPYDPENPQSLKERYDALKLGHCSTLIDALSDCMLGSMAVDKMGGLFKNKYHKHRSECSPYLGGKCALDQQGIQIISRSGATMAFCDSVEEPQGGVGWENGMYPYDMDGCTGVFRGRTFWESATEHVIEMNDEENEHGIRGKKNGIHIRDATGNYVILSSHSKPCCRAGDTRGVHIGSTAKHTIDLVDNGNQQCSKERKGCGKPARADRALIRIRSGYGIAMTMNDGYSQTQTDQQYFQIMSPQKDNTERGPHMLHMQEQPSGPGQVFLRAGGDFIIQTYDNMVEVVGVEGSHVSNKMEFISGKKILSCGDYYYSTAKNHLFWSDEHIFLLAGNDCKDWNEAGEEITGPCIYPVVVACQAIPEFVTKMCGIKASERVFASAQPCHEPCLVGGEIGTNTLTEGGGSHTLTTGEMGTFTITTGGGP